MTPESWCFLHAADLHIDSPMRGLVAYEGAPAEALRLATREAFRAMIELALARGVRFVILAGDLFDGDWPDFESRLWFVTQVRTLTAAGIGVYAVRGNHDAESRMTSELRWPEGARVFRSKSPESIEIGELDVVLHGQSYNDPKTEQNLARDYPGAVAGKLNIGVLHTALEGREGHGTYAPCTTADLEAKGYDYWALGHVHAREVVAEDPWIVFPGNLQGRHVRETGAKGVSLVHVVEGSIQSVEHVDCDVARWVVVSVDASGLTGEDELLSLIEEQLQGAFEGGAGRLVAARVQVTGTTSLDPVLRLDEVRFVQEVRASAARVSADLWVEKIKLQTVAPVAQGPAHEGLRGLGQRIVTAELEDEELANLTRQLAKLSGRLPAGVRAAYDPGDRKVLRAALDPARRYLAAMLSRVDEGPANGDDA